MPKLYLLDGNNYFWRFFHTPMGDLSVPCCGKTDCPACLGTGREPTKATYLLIREIIRLIEKDRPDYLGIAFDGDRSDLVRKQLYPNYKGNRLAQHPDALPQFRRIRQILKVLGIPTIWCRGYEADDALGRLALEALHQGIKCSVFSRDKDLRQLCSYGILVCDPYAGRWYDQRNAGRPWRLKAEQITEFLMLAGDSADGVPGIKGLGEQTAAKLLRQFGTLDDLILACSMNLVPRRTAERLVQAHSSGWIKTLRQLIELDFSVELPITALDLRFAGLKLSDAGPIFRKLGFRSME